ncbi:MAG: hypothetical protein KDE03_05240 [Rhodobacteraceae bacterium]|nr:hypothetical protein [Paracoccaceae bacterium]
MKINVILRGGECPRAFKLSGRLGWTFYQLYRAGACGVTPLEKPALRWSSYVHQLREKGIPIDTEIERHSGIYKGIHARYRLACDAVVAVSGMEAGE